MAIVRRLPTVWALGIRWLNFGKTSLLISVALVAVALPVASGQGSASQEAPAATVQMQDDWQKAAGGSMSFDVASIRLSSPGTFERPNMGLNTEDYFRPTGGLFSADVELVTYIEFAYKLIMSPDQAESIRSQLPRQLAAKSFTIHARASGDPTKDQYRLMMQSLLAERFKLKVHFEKRDIPVLALMLVRPRTPGSKLRPHGDGPACKESDQSTEASPFTCGRYNLISEANQKFLWGSRNALLCVMGSYLSALPPRNLDRPVVDQTGLSGRFDFTVEWLPAAQSPTPEGTSREPDALEPSLEEALEEQLGLKLKPTHALVTVLVIDHAEMPSEN
jgi:uncharacterized protein (TIGR03435 family)